MYISVRHIQTGSQLVQHLTIYVIIQCSDKMAVRSKAGLWEGVRRGCDN